MASQQYYNMDSGDIIYAGGGEAHRTVKRELESSYQPNHPHYPLQNSRVLSSSHPGTSAQQNYRTDQSQQFASSTSTDGSFDLLKELEKSVTGATLDLYTAGSAIEKAYSLEALDIQKCMTIFTSKYFKTVTIMKNPDQFSPLSNSTSAMMHGYGLMSRFAHAAATKASFTIGSGVEDLSDFNRLTGAAFHVKRDFFYPKEAPFSGLIIDLSTLPVSDAKTHVKLKHFLYKLMGSSCKNPRDVQRAWLLPNDKYHNYKHPTPFPEKLYEDLKELFLFYFEIDAPELDVQSYRTEFGNLSFLSNYKEENMKKKVFKQRSNARATYLQHTFHKQLKAALKELKDSTFSQLDSTQPGKFTYRKRDTPKRKEVISRSIENATSFHTPKRPRTDVNAAVRTRINKTSLPLLESNGQVFNGDESDSN